MESVEEKHLHDRVFDLEERFVKALEIALSYGPLERAENKMWCIDQMVRTLLKDEYEKVIADYRAPGENGFEPYIWEEGVKP